MALTRKQIRDQNSRIDGVAQRLRDAPGEVLPKLNAGSLSLSYGVAPDIAQNLLKSELARRI